MGTDWMGPERRDWLPALIALEGVLQQYVRAYLETGEPRWECMAQQLRLQVAELKEWILCCENVSSLTDAE